MCGVIGMVKTGGGQPAERMAMFACLMDESRVRGMHAAGAWYDGDLVKHYDVDDVVAAAPPDPTRIIAHTRYSTSGDWHDHANNQPLAVEGWVLAFNGVIDQSDKATRARRWSLPLETDNDGELFIRWSQHGEARLDVGSFAGVWFDGEQVRYGRNADRPLWRFEAAGATWAASTLDIIERAAEQANVPTSNIREVDPGEVACLR